MKWLNKYNFGTKTKTIEWQFAVSHLYDGGSIDDLYSKHKIGSATKTMLFAEVYQLIQFDALKPVVTQAMLAEINSANTEDQLKIIYNKYPNLKKFPSWIAYLEMRKIIIS